ncbi:unnamed protein product [Lepeophtheirus salmonis]|uniref:(salmon louse) hypothetical protein n=1 Tax=Lepeophtheirus salmonis TaxID=72036 RepID=A0A7R8D593_LEPSM|nr:unnamed protein product [Lepeophtheirus salmonis]CAF3028567.1 unnamed protein product [Lepeophtheirus salmonis]
MCESLYGFFSAGLLPELPEPDVGSIPLLGRDSPIPYVELSSIYKNKRRHMKILHENWDYSDIPLLLIDGLWCNEEMWNEMIDRLIQFPSAFSVPPSIIKLTQAFWLLDQGDFEEAMVALLVQNQPKSALKYSRTRNPPIKDSFDIKLHVSVLLSTGNIHEAFQFQRNRRNTCKDLLNYFFIQAEKLDFKKQCLIIYYSSKKKLSSPTHQAIMDRYSDLLPNLLVDSKGYDNMKVTCSFKLPIPLSREVKMTNFNPVFHTSIIEKKLEDSFNQSSLSSNVFTPFRSREQRKHLIEKRKFVEVQRTNSNEDDLIIQSPASKKSRFIETKPPKKLTPSILKNTSYDSESTPSREVHFKNQDEITSKSLRFTVPRKLPPAELKPVTTFESTSDDDDVNETASKSESFFSTSPSLKDAVESKILHSPHRKKKYDGNVSSFLGKSPSLSYSNINTSNPNIEDSRMATPQTPELSRSIFNQIKSQVRKEEEQQKKKRQIQKVPEKKSISKMQEEDSESNDSNDINQIIKGRAVADFDKTMHDNFRRTRSDTLFKSLVAPNVANNNRKFTSSSSKYIEEIKRSNHGRMSSFSMSSNRLSKDIKTTFNSSLERDKAGKLNTANPSVSGSSLQPTQEGDSFIKKQAAVDFLNYGHTQSDKPPFVSAESEKCDNKEDISPEKIKAKALKSAEEWIKNSSYAKTSNKKILETNDVDDVDELVQENEPAKDIDVIDETDELIKKKEFEKDCDVILETGEDEDAMEGLIKERAAKDFDMYKVTRKERKSLTIEPSSVPVLKKLNVPFQFNIDSEDSDSDLLDDDEDESYIVEKCDVSEKKISFSSKCISSDESSPTKHKSTHQHSPDGKTIDRATNSILNPSSPSDNTSLQKESEESIHKTTSVRRKVKDKSTTSSLFKKSNNKPLPMPLRSDIAEQHDLQKESSSPDRVGDILSDDDETSQKKYI